MKKNRFTVIWKNYSNHLITFSIFYGKINIGDYMTKFSIIVPVYNVEKYINNCLKSIESQTFSNFEVIVVNDGTKDNSQKIIDEYVKKDDRFKSFCKENGGLSSARNFGIKYATGDYLVFVDSDDTINENLLFELNEEINKNNNLDLIKYEVKIKNVTDTIEKNILFSYVDGEEAFKNLISSSLFVTAWSYAYRKKFWDHNNFLYENGRIHEDFGLTPFVVLKAKSVSSIDYVGYNYYIRTNSIMTSTKLEKMADDMLYHFDNLFDKVNTDKYISDSTIKIFNSYISNALIVKASTLSGNELDEYIKSINKRNISKYLLTDTLIRKIKKILYKINPKLYIKFFIKG